MNNIKRITPLLLVAMISMVSCGNKTNGKNFHFASYKTAEAVDYKVFFDEEYFSHPASEYQTGLATASACLALAGFSSTIGHDYVNSPNNAKEFFNKLGFNNFMSNDFGISQPTRHSFGVYIAKKSIDDYTLLGITVRGAGYLSEWASNVTLGESGDFAEGFYEASSIYLDTLNSYIGKHNVTGNIKIWTAGYSRGGAGVNLAIGRIDDALANNETILSSDVSFTKDDLYAYCFESPAGKNIDLDGNNIIQKGENYSNIHCLLNMNDPVPFVAPTEFNFARYGVDHYLPDIINSIDYKSHISRVKNAINKLPNANIIGEYQIDNFVYRSIADSTKKYNWTMGRFLSKFINLLATGIGSRSDFASKFETTLGDIFELIYKNGTPKDSIVDLGITIGKNIILMDPNEILLQDLQFNPKRFFADLKPLLQKALESTAIENISVDEMMHLLESLSDALLSVMMLDEGVSCIFTLISMSNLKALGSAHYPELLLSHMRSMDSNYVSGNLASPVDSSWKLVVETSYDYTITLNNKILAESKGDVFETSLVTEQREDEDIYYLPANQPYFVDIDGDLGDISLYEKRGDYFEDLLIDSATTNHYEANK